MSAVLVMAILLPLLGVAGGRLLARTRGVAGLAQGGAVLTGLAFACAVAVTAATAFDGPVSAVLAQDGRAIAGFYANRIGALLLLLVLGVSAVVQVFAGRYLHGDDRAPRFFAATGLLTSATATVACSATLIGLAIGWTLSGVALILALGLYTQMPAAREGVRRTIRAFTIGDAALWAAVAIATITWGGLDMRRLGDGTTLSGHSEALAVVACLLVIAALARCAQLPFQGWLPVTLAAPTPVSALLHAGIVNAGGILLVRMSPLFGASTAATGIAFTAGAATTVYGTTLMLTKPDVKGALTHSTMGQMGFMIMTCGLGAFAAAIFHLVAHGMYKATLFLGSGSAVTRLVRHEHAPPAPRLTPAARAWVIAVCAVAPAALIAGLLLISIVPVQSAHASAAPLLFAWATSAWATWGWLNRHATARGVLVAMGVLLVVLGAYVTALEAFTRYMEPALRGAGTATVSSLWLIVVVALLGAITLIRLSPPLARLGEWHRTLYVLALGAGQAVTPARVRGTGARGTQPVVRPNPAAATTGVRS